MTVNNENLFSMMQDNLSREQDKKLKFQQANNINLGKIMGSLQTYKEKQSKRDPSRRVNMPYYHRVISRSRNKNVFGASAQNSDQAIMLSKQLPLLDRKKKSVSPTNKPTHVKSTEFLVHGQRK